MEEIITNLALPEKTQVNSNKANVEILKHITKDKKKVISFSLWGDNPKYLVGANYNAIIARQLFVDDGGWICRFYVSKDMNVNLIKTLIDMDNVEVYKVLNDEINGLFWRFLPPIDDESIEAFIVRDTDSRLSLREYISVCDWYNSNKRFHIIRDHPHHDNVVLGGLWGMKKINNKFPIDLQLYKSTLESYWKNKNWGCDQTWLWEKIIPEVTKECLIHDEINTNITPNFNMTIPYPRFELDFIGEVFEANNQQKERDKKIMKDFLDTKKNIKESKISEIKEEDPLISVIIPTFNRPNDILNAINSVKRQEKYSNVEIIVVNDGSTVPYPEMKDIILINLPVNTKKKFGFACAGYVRNIGAKIATGEYYIFLDDDDFMMPNRLHQQYNFIKDKNKFGCSECYIGKGPYDKNNKKVLYNSEHYKNEINKKINANEIPKELDLMTILAHNVIIQSSVMIHKNLFNKVGGFDNLPNGSEDVGLWIKCLHYSNCDYDSTALNYYQLR